MPGLRAALLLPVLLLPVRAQATNRADAWLRSQQGPVLVLLEPVAKDPGFWLRLQTTLEEDPLADRTLTALQMHQGKQPSPLADALQATFRLDQARWALLAPPDRLLASGRELPRAQALADALQAAGIASPLQILRDFLREHPDHLEARLDYLQRLRIPAENRTRKALGLSVRRDTERIADGETQAMLLPKAVAAKLPPKGKELAAKDDARIWGTLARELDQVFTRGDWLEMGSLVDPVHNLPMEAASPNMTAVYQRHRARILEALRSDPGNATLQVAWAWIQVVLREPLLPTYRTLPAPAVEEGLDLTANFGNFGNFASSGQFLLRVLVEEAQEGGDWMAAQPALAELCRSVVQTIFTAQGGWVSWDPSTDISKGLRRGAWEQVALPFLEACLRTGREGEAGLALDAAAKAPEAAELLQAAAASARKLGRADLARTWTAWAAPDKKPLPELLRWWPQCRFVFMNPPRGEAEWWQVASSPQLGGFDLSVITYHEGRGSSDYQKQYEELRQFLGWTGSAPRWALLDPKGKVLDQGLERPEAARIESVLRGAGVMPRLERLQKHLKDDPDDPRLLGLLLGELSKRLLRTGTTATVPAGWKPGDPPPPSVLKPEGQAMLPELLDVSRRCLEAGYWRRPGASGQAFSWAPGTRIEELQPMTEAWLEAVEEALVRSPARWTFWNLWESLRKAGTERPVQPFFARLVPNPLQRSNFWPPRQVVNALVQEYRSRGKWTDLEALGRSRWAAALELMDRIKASGRTNPSFPGSWDMDVAPLVEALLQLGRSADADGFVQAWAGMGGQLRGLDPLAALARKLGFESLAASWQEQAKSAGRGGPR